LTCIQSAQVCGVETLGSLTVYDLKRRQAVATAASGGVYTTLLSPTGRLLGGMNAGSGITIHRTDGGRPAKIDTSKLGLNDFAFAADEKSIVAINIDGALYRYDTGTGTAIGRSAVVADIPWSNAHIEGTGDGRFVVWDQERVRLVSADLSTIAGHFDGGGEVLAIKTDPAGSRLAIFRRMESLTVWDISPNPGLPTGDDDARIAAACERVGRTLTPEEWATYLPNRPYAPQCRKSGWQ
jgi:hypothetical protein